MTFMFHKFLGVIIKRVVVKGSSPLIDTDMRVEIKINFGQIRDIIQVDHVQK